MPLAFAYPQLEWLDKTGKYDIGYQQQQFHKFVRRWIGGEWTPVTSRMDCRRCRLSIVRTESGSDFKSL